MNTLKNRLAAWGRMAKVTWNRFLGRLDASSGCDALGNAAYLVAAVLFAVPTLVVILVFGERRS
jgi:hypothetical protein